MQLEDLRPRCAVRGVHPDGVVTVVSVQWFGSEALELTYKTLAGTVANELLYRHDEARLKVVTQGRPWSFDGDGALFRLVSEAQRIRLAHLFDPVLAVHTSVVDPLPHQITAVYEAMLPRQPLRFLLADDPGAGKTIMAGLLIKELIARGDLERCLIVCPGSLAEQWQDELYRRFQLPFEILTNDKLDAARTRNWFLETDLVIARLDKLSRDEDVQQKLQAPDAGWDLVVCDEAHKLSATFFGGEIKYTKRYRLGQLLSGLTRHFLLMTATPHNGKETDFQLFLALIDGDRFEGRFRDGAHAADVSDLMRRMVKERLLKFDGKPLFPERIAYTVPYKLSDEEARLYKAVTDYVREEFNRADALANAKRAGTVGFALTISSGGSPPRPRRSSSVAPAARAPGGPPARARCAASAEGSHPPALRSRLRSSTAERRGSRRRTGAGGRGRRGAHSRSGDRRALQRGAEGGDRDPEGTRSARDRGTPRRPGHEVAPARERVGEVFTAARLWVVSGSRRSRTAPARFRVRDPPRGRSSCSSPSTGTRCGTCGSASPLCSAVRSRSSSFMAAVGREERLAVQEAFRHDPQVQVLLATDAAGEGIKPAARAPDGQLRPALEPEPAGATLRPHPPDWPDRSLSSVEPGRRRDP